MTKFEQWIDLGKQKRQARRIMRDKQSELMVCENDIPKVGCIKIIPYQIQNTVSDNNVTEYNFYMKSCESFTRNIPCNNIHCSMHKKNVEYVEAVKVFEALKSAKRQAFIAMFTRSK